MMHESPQLLKIFKDLIGTYTKESPIVIFDTCLSFVPPVLHILNRKGFGVIFHDPTSRGNILTPIMEAVWGESVRLSWQDYTSHPQSRRLTRLLPRFAGRLLVVDERIVGGDHPRQIGQLLHDLSCCAAEGWPGCNDGSFVFAAETSRSPENLLAEAGLAPDLGLIGIQGNCRPDYWPFHTIYDFASASHLASYLKEQLSQTAGVAKANYLIFLTRQFNKNPKRLISCFEHQVQQYKKFRQLHIEAADEFILDIFPLIYAVGVSAVYCGLLPYSYEDILNAVQSCEEAYLTQYIDVAGKDNLVMLLVEYITNFQNQFWQYPQEGPFDLKKPPGLYKTDADGNIVEYCFHPSRFRSEFARVGVNDLLEDCNVEGFVSRSLGGWTRRVQFWPNEDGRAYVYCFRPEIINHKAQPYQISLMPKKTFIATHFGSSGDGRRIRHRSRLRAGRRARAGGRRPR